MHISNIPAEVDGIGGATAQLSSGSGPWRASKSARSARSRGRPASRLSATSEANPATRRRTPFSSASIESAATESKSSGAAPPRTRSIRPAVGLSTRRFSLAVIVDESSAAPSGPTSGTTTVRLRREGCGQGGSLTVERNRRLDPLARAERHHPGRRIGPVAPLSVGKLTLALRAVERLGHSNILTRAPGQSWQSAGSHGSGGQRRGRDSNPRSRVTGLRFSRPVHSTTLPPLRRRLWQLRWARREFTREFFSNPQVFRGCRGATGSNTGVGLGDYR